jgi:hypothetical protein
MHSKKIILIVATAALALGFCIFWVFRSPRPEWDRSPQTLVLSEGPYMLAEIDYNYIPKYQIWGDGYIVWVEYDENKNRTVFQGYLPEKEMAQLVTRVVDEYFSIARRLSSKEGFPYNSIEIALLDGSYSEMISPDDKDLFEVIQFMGNGAGVQGTEFTPTIGELLVAPADEAGYKNIEASFSWPDENFGYNLEEVSEQRSIDGEELRFAWEIVNTPNPIVESSGELYWIAVLVPKISYGAK